MRCHRSRLVFNCCF